MSESTSGSGESARDQSKEVARIAAFSDGVYAIAITLLSLQLEVPTSGDLAQGLAALAPFFLSFVISFLVIGTYWMAHHRLFAVVERYDRRFIWLNMLVLFFIVLQPFTTSLVGERGEHTIAVAVYALSVAAVGFAHTGLAAYALRGHRLCSPRVTDSEISYSLWRGLVVSLVFALSVLLLPFGPDAPKYVWFVLPLAQYLVRRRYARPGEA